MLAAGAATVVAVLITAAVGLGGSPLTSAPQPTRSPSSEMSPTNALRARPQGPPPRIDYVAGGRAHLGGRDVALPDGWSTLALVGAGGSWFVLATTREGRFVARVAADGSVEILDGHDPAGLAADPLGRYVAWGSVQRQAPGVERLTVYDARERTFVRRAVDQPVLVHGWAREGVIASHAVDPDGSPFVWNPVTDEVTAVWGEAGDGPSFVAYSPAGSRWVLLDGLTGCNVVIDRLGGTDPERACRPSLTRPAAFVQRGRLLAATSGDTVRVVDRTLSDAGDGQAMPAGSSPIQIVEEGGARWLVVVADPADGLVYVLRCARPGTCERAVDGRRGERITLVANP